MEIFDEVREKLQQHNFKILAEDLARPWGGFFALNESQIEDFISAYFSGVHPPYRLGVRMSPKVLIVAPGKRTSWQYHDRRYEWWSVIKGPVGAVAGATDDQPELKTLKMGEKFRIEPKIRHRLVGLDVYGVVAEIWYHIDPAHPSDEQDITRVQDDFRR